MVILSATTSHNSPATTYTMVDTSTNRNDALNKRIKLVASDGTILFDSGVLTDLSINTFAVPITAQWITTMAILQVQVFLAYTEFGGTVTGPLQDNYLLPTISNIKQ